MTRRVLLLLGLPLVAGCPTFSYGPEAAIAAVSSAECVEAGLSRGCTSFRFDNGDVYTEPIAQPVWLRIAFDAPERNLEHVHLEFEIPGMPVEGRTCTIPGGSSGAHAEIEDELGCFSVGLLDAPEGSSADPSSTANGIMDVGAALLAKEPGSYAISAWLTDDNGFDSPVVRWQFQVIEPLRQKRTKPALQPEQ